jgi:putative cardiolipin synthase
MRWLRRLLPLFVLPLAGCASLPRDVERPVSTALAAPEATALGQLAASRRPAGARGGESGFALVDSPDRAYASRLALTRQASRTLDIQYYAIHADASTRELLREVRAAAARGVRVRILLDDFNSTGQNALVMGMAFLTGVEMRMFNPLPGARGAGVLRTLGSLHDFQRIQHRMHNKLYIADNAWGIIGGRNLGDAYFGTADGSNFVDMDMLAVGPVVQAMSASFDRYWNNPLAYPVASLVSREELRTLRDATPPAAPQAPALPPPLDLARLPLTWAPAALLADAPAKLVPELNDEHTEDSVVDGMLSLLRLARRDALIVSPYFVPGAQMQQLFADLARRGVRVRVLTNSLASNDAPLAHVGYARHREALIRQGVELYEMRAQQGARLNRSMLGSSPGGSQASLHAKVLIVDGRVFSIGSMNLDWRSKLQNTEVALIVRSRVLARQAQAEVEEALNHGAWQVMLTPEGRLRWRAPPGADFGDADSEPDASLGLRLLMNILGPLAPDEML